MPRRKSMRKIKECLRLRFDSGMNQSQIARALCISRSAVQEYWRRFEVLERSWPELREESDYGFEQLLFHNLKQSKERFLPDFSYLHAELRRKGVTLQLLWEEYVAEHPDGYRYSQFCDKYRLWAKGLRSYMRFLHKGGEKIFVDYSGKKPVIVDRKTGEIKPVELFVMVWGASHYIYAEAQESQALPNWVMGHVRGLEYFPK